MSAAAVNSFGLARASAAPNPTQRLWTCLDQALSSYPDYETYFESRGNAEIRKAIQDGAQINELFLHNEEWRLPLHTALSFALPTKTIRILLEEGRANPLLTDAEGNTAFFKTVYPEIWALLQQFAPITMQQILELRNKVGGSIVTNMAESYSGEDVHMLAALDFLKGQGVIITQDVIDKRPELIKKKAPSGLGIKVVELLLQMGYPAKTADLHDALLHGQFAFAGLLINQGAPCTEAIWLELLSRLHWMENEAKCQLAKVVMQKIDPVPFGWTKLHFTAYLGMNEELLAELKLENPPINAPCKDANRAPLHLAAAEERLLCVFLLLEVGKANPSQLDAEQQMPQNGVRVKAIDQLLQIYRDVLNPAQRKEKLIVWVADTEKPMRDAYGKLMQRPDGQIFAAAQFYPKRLKEIEDIKTILGIA